MLKCDLISVACQHIYAAYQNKSHVNMIMSHVDIIYLACKGQKYATKKERERAIYSIVQMLEFLFSERTNG